MGYRKQIRFWLNLEDDSEYAIAEQVEILKRQRNFTAAIRDGIRLVCDLRAGRVDVLLELFPFVRSALSDKPAPPDTGDLERKLDQIQQQLLSAGTPPPVVASAAPKPIAVPKLPAPVLDDDTPELVTIRRDTSTDSSKNFLNAALALNA
jgi:hypothetical protein